MITYRVDTNPANATYPLSVEFFEADADNQEGQTFLGRDSYSATDHSGCGTPPCSKTVTFVGALGLSPGDRLVATATDTDGNTSEFSPSVVTGPVTRYVDAESGSDTSNDCSTMGSPCQTLAHAVSQAYPGDTLSLAGGTYAAPGVIGKALTIIGVGVIGE